MNTEAVHPIARACGLVSMAVCALGAHADPVAQITPAPVTTYTSLTSYNAVATTSQLADFDGLATGRLGTTLTTSGITIAVAIANTNDVYISPAKAGLFDVQNLTQVLTADGDENFRFQLASGGSFTAIGFDFYSNPYNAPMFAFYDSGSALIATVTVPQAKSSLGFIGFTSTTPIAYMTSTVDRGGLTNTGFDNLRMGVSAVPEPAPAGLWLVGVAALIGTRRLARRRSR